MNSSTAMRSHQTGLTLIEVLTAVLVLSIGLLGIAGLQTSALTNNFYSYQYAQAANLSQGMLERMRANRSGVLKNNYSLAAGATPTSPPTNCASTQCSPADQATWDIAVWYAQITGTNSLGSNAPILSPKDPSNPGKYIAVFPGSTTTASISCPNPFPSPVTASAICVISIYWDANRDGSTGYGCNPANTGAGGDLRCYQVAFTP